MCCVLLCMPRLPPRRVPFFFFNDTATTEIYTLSLHDALPICRGGAAALLAREAVGKQARGQGQPQRRRHAGDRSEEHTSELQSPDHLVCRLLLEKKKQKVQKPNVVRPPAKSAAANRCDTTYAH